MPYVALITRLENVDILNFKNKNNNNNNKNKSQFIRRHNAASITIRVHGKNENQLNMYLNNA